MAVARVSDQAGGSFLQGGLAHGAFEDVFQRLTGHEPFPWQRALYDRFVQGDIPVCCHIPTGLGKTAVVAIWLIALAHRPDLLPRRLVYVVNRRTVVDQTTHEVERSQTLARVFCVWLIHEDLTALGYAVG